MGKDVSDQDKICFFIRGVKYVSLLDRVKSGMHGRAKMNQYGILTCLLLCMLN